MTTAAPPLPAPPSVLPPAAAPAGENRFVLRGVTWSVYEGLMRAFEGRHVRITYDRGAVEIMTTSSRHERVKKLLGALLELLALRLGVPLVALGNFTCRREDLDRGVEADDCCYLGERARQMAPRTEQGLDFTTDPPPDLAVEVEVSRSVVDRLGVCAALGVPEVWRCDGVGIRVLRLGGGGYDEAPASLALPQTPVAEIAQFLARREQLDNTSILAAFEEWVRANLAAGPRP